MKLDTVKCTPCQGGIPPISRDEAIKYLKEISGWELIDNSTKLKKDFKFPDFLSALSFVNEISQLSEKEGHHPDISFGWGYVRIFFYTHKINGLNKNDFVMAAKVDSLIQGD